MGIENFFTFFVTALIFIMTPGIDTLFILNKSIGQGRKAGVYATLGINSGIIVHTAFAALGLSIIVAKSALVFMMIKYLGAIYLIYLGVSKFIKPSAELSLTTEKESSSSNKAHFVSGLITNVFNPKVALFFLAFFPQFITPSKINSPLPFVILGITYAITGIAWLLILTFFASTFSKKLSAEQKVSQWINRTTGAVFVLMGIKIALTKR